MTYKEKTLNKIPMFTFSERNLRRAFQKFETFHFTRAAVDVLNKMEELKSELHRRVYYCLFKKKMKRIKNNPNYYASIGNIM